MMPQSRRSLLTLLSLSMLLGLAGSLNSARLRRRSTQGCPIRRRRKP